MGPAPADYQNLTVSDFLLPDSGTWNLEMIQLVLPFEETKILALKPSRTGAPDKLSWMGSKSGNYTTKTGYATALTNRLGHRLVGSIKENYPDLKSNDNMRTLMAQLEGTENRINVARTRYNASVRNYNNKVVSFPSSLVASVTGHSKANYFNADDKAQTNPEVNFNN